MLRKAEFAKFVKKIFRITNSSYYPKEKDINDLYSLIKLEEGKVTRENIYDFLKELAQVSDPQNYNDEEMDSIE